MRRRRGRDLFIWFGAALVATVACGPAGQAPLHPTWSDVAPVVRGACVSCHGWTASDRPADAAGVHPPNTGGSLRFDFYDVTPEVCGDAALAVDPTVGFAGAPAVASEIADDVVTADDARWPRMPPQPSPALPAWELDTLTRWSLAPVKGPPPPTNRPPTIVVNQFPSQVDRTLSFTAIIDDPDGDSVVGVIEVGGLTFLMNRPGSFDVRLDASGWPSGIVHPTAVVCDGWTRQSTDLGPVTVQH